MMKKRAAAFALISLVGGSLWIVRQMVTGPGDQLRVSAAAYLLSALILSSLLLFLKIPKPERSAVASNLVLGVTLVACPLLFTMWAASHVSPGLAAIIPAATPLVVTYFCDGLWRARNAAIAGLAGVILLFADIVSFYTGQWTGVVALLVALMATAGSLVFAKKKLTQSHPIFSAAVELATAGVVLEAASILFGGQGGALLTSLWVPIICISAGVCVMYPLYFWLLQRIRPDQLASVVWAQLLVSIMEGVLLVRPHIPFRMILGAAVIGGALAFLGQAEPENKLLTVRVTPRPR